MPETPFDQVGNRIRLIAVFLPNRLGALLSLHRALDAASIRILGLSVVDAADHAVARLVVDQPTLAASTLRHGGYGFVESDVLAAAFGPDLGIKRMLSAVLAGEVNIHYVFSLLQPVRGRNILVLNVDDATSAARLLVERGLELVDQGEFASEID